MNKKRLFEDNDTKKRNYIKNKILKINEILNNGNQIEQLAKKINKIITESKINYLGTKDQKYSGECWVYSLSEIIYMASARKYGRELEDFGKIYSYIIDQNPKSGKIDDKIEIIMDKVLPHYGLCYKKVDDISILENFLKDGIKCLAIFDLNNSNVILNNDNNYNTDELDNENDKFKDSDQFYKNIIDNTSFSDDNFSLNISSILPKDKCNNKNKLKNLIKKEYESFLNRANTKEKETKYEKDNYIEILFNNIISILLSMKTLSINTISKDSLLIYLTYFLKSFYYQNIIESKMKFINNEYKYIKKETKQKLNNLKKDFDKYKNNKNGLN
jgi:hypothetical protein